MSMLPTKYSAHFKLSRLTDRTLGYLLDCLTAVNEELLENDPTIPLLYESGVRYYHDNRDDPWMDVLEVLEAHERFKKTGKPEIIDCEDLVAYRVAELRVRFGENARPVFTRERVVTSEGPKQFVHILVERVGGQIEDVSRKLGMGTVPSTLSQVIALVR